MTLLLLLACHAKGHHALESVEGRRTVGDLEVTAYVSTLHTPGQGWDLQVVYNLDNNAVVSGIRFDMVRTRLQVDGGAWLDCKHDPKLDQNRLIFRMQPGDSKTVTLSCLDIPRPDETLRVSFETAGAGQSPIELSFEGLQDGKGSSTTE